LLRIFLAAANKFRESTILIYKPEVMVIRKAGFIANDGITTWWNHQPHLVISPIFLNLVNDIKHFLRINTMFFTSHFPALFMAHSLHNLSEG